jgi:hypothetical protein
MNIESNTEPTLEIKIYIAGPLDLIKDVIRKHIFDKPLCVTVHPIDFMYTGGEELGVEIGLRNYPRFPSSSGELEERAGALATLLIKKCFQKTALVVGPKTTRWFHREMK